MLVWSLQRLATWAMHFLIDRSSSDCVWRTLAVLLLVFVWRKLYFAWRENRSLPPGPCGMPIVGYLPYLNGDFHEQLTAMARKYGPVFSLKLGTKTMVVLGDHRTIREAFRREEFAARPDNDFIRILEGYGIVNTEGKLWKDQRRFLHERLRHFGVKHLGSGRELMEARIMVEVETLLQNLANERAAPIDMSSYLASAVSNVICSLLMSVRFNHDDPRFLRFTTLMDEGFRLFTAAAAAVFIPILRFLPGISFAYNKIRQNREEIGHFFKEIVKVHKDSFDPNNVRDVIDSYLLEIHRAKEEGRQDSLFEGKNADRQMEQIIGDLFSAGSETVKTTLQWATLFALREQDIQARVQAELDQVVGRRRLPSLSDLPNLPYTEAVILEVMRRATAVPLGTTHATSRTTTLNGHTIPKGIEVIPLLHAVHMDPTLWKDPEMFNPERFLTPDGRIHKPEFFMPFGVGRRMCLGDVLAKAELFLFFSSLLHTFSLQVPAGADLPSLKGQAGATVSPQKFNVCAVPRHIEICSVDSVSSMVADGSSRGL